VKAGVWVGVGEIRCQDWPDPDLDDDLLIVEVAYCGFCGSDANIISGVMAAGKPPRVLGHEVAGTIVAVGKAVQGFATGTRVACDLFGYCGRCAWCRAGQPNHCSDTWSSAKGFAEYVAYRPDQLYPIGDDVPFEHGAFLEPLANCVHALDIAALRVGENVLVAGAGAIGLLALQVAKLGGAGRVAVSEPDAAKRALARRLGADLVIDPASEDLLGISASVGMRGGFDIVIEASGSPAAAAQAPALLASRGRLVIVSTFGSDTEISLSPALLLEREITVVGSLSTSYSFPRALELLSRVQVDGLITASEPLSDIARVYRDHLAGNYIRALVKP
jgi:2-desacetyl-2-hydroxyethyl bacteriochlorophyllide A dehydrogenase